MSRFELSTSESARLNVVKGIVQNIQDTQTEQCEHMRDLAKSMAFLARSIEHHARCSGHSGS